MITSLYLEQFKCFAHLRLPLAPLTLLTGLNAAGKSSAIQPLVLLHQTMTQNMFAKSLVLNGPLLELGRFGDVVNEVQGRDHFSIRLDSDVMGVGWVFHSVSKHDFEARVRSCSVLPGAKFRRASLGVHNTFFPRPEDSGEAEVAQLGEIERWLFGMLYLSTERIGPREIYPSNSLALSSSGTLAHLGPREINASNTGLSEQAELGKGGELTPWFLLQHGERQVQSDLLLDATTTLARQVEARLAEFFPGSALELKSVEGTNSVTLRIRTTPGGRFHRPQNVGFGLTNILPILTAFLAASPGVPVIIENPEAHLHPAAQAKMGRLAAQVAAAGVQVILESHSDHILNGIRRAVKDGVLPPDSVAIHFFQPGDAEGAEPTIVSPVMNEAGILDHWPNGFFDQFDRDLEALTNWNAGG